MVASAAASVSAYLQFACGHAALVTLPRVKGETARQRDQRVAFEKVSALSRQCDFCAPQSATVQAPPPTPGDGVTVDHHDQENSVVTVSDSSESPSSTQSTSSSEGNEGGSAPRPLGEGAAFSEGNEGPPPLRRLSDEQEKELPRLYSETDTPVPQIASRFGVGE